MRLVYCLCFLIFFLIKKKKFAQKATRKSPIRRDETKELFFFCHSGQVTLKTAGDFKKNKKDNHSREGMIKLISRRRRLIAYLKKKDFKKYEEIIKKLNLRK